MTAVTRRRFRRIFPLVLAVTLSGCFDCGENGPPTTPGPTPRVPVTRYVAVTGTNAANDCTVQGRPCLTIQFGHDQSLTGDTMIVGAGTYRETITLARTVHVRGAGTDASGTVIVGSIVSQSTQFTVDIENFSLRPANQGGSVHGIDLRRSAGESFHVAFVDIRGFSGDGINVSGAGGFLGLANLYLSQNADGIHITGGGQVSLAVIRAEANRGDGIQFSGISPPTTGGTNAVGGDRLVLFLNGEAGLQVETMAGTPFNITNSCVLNNGSQAGITLQDVTSSPIRVDATNIEGNGSGGASLIATSGGTLSAVPDMSGNFWGAPTGPSGAGPGFGDSVTLGILINPWRTSRVPNISGCS